MFEGGLTMPYVKHSTSISAGTCRMDIYIYTHIYIHTSVCVCVCIFCIILYNHILNGLDLDVFFF